MDELRLQHDSVPLTSNAFHLKARFECTLSDLSEEMLSLSRATNPECQHVVGDMRTLRLRAEGLFPKETWRRVLESVGYRVEMAERVDEGNVDEVFLCKKS